MEKLRLPMLDEETFDLFDNIEEMEELFGFEFSCGDGLFLSDLDGDALRKYDGNLDLELFRKDGAICRSEDYYLRFGWENGYDSRQELFSDCKVIKYRGAR